jgi:hypothetical protein
MTSDMTLSSCMLLCGAIEMTYDQNVWPGYKVSKRNGQQDRTTAVDPWYHRSDIESLSKVRLAGPPVSRSGLRGFMLIDCRLSKLISEPSAVRFPNV